MSDPSFFVIVYDIVQDKRRAKVARFLEAVGERVQKSVFEVYLTPAELAKLLKKLEKHLNREEDSIRIYDLCAPCRKKVRSLGQGEITPPPRVMIV